MKIKLNGKEREISGEPPVYEFLKECRVSAEKTVVILNGKVLSPEEQNAEKIREGDELELFSFVGGG